jgi:hypothetical protein
MSKQLFNKELNKKFGDIASYALQHGYIDVEAMRIRPANINYINMEFKNMINFYKTIHNDIDDDDFVKNDMIKIIYKNPWVVFSDKQRSKLVLARYFDEHYGDIVAMSGGNKRSNRKSKSKNKSKKKKISTRKYH